MIVLIFGVFLAVVAVLSAIAAIILLGVFFWMVWPLTIMVVVVGIVLIPRYRSRARSQTEVVDMDYWNAVSAASAAGEAERWEQAQERPRQTTKPPALD